MNPLLEHKLLTTRRHLLGSMAGGIGAIAMHDLLGATSGAPAPSLAADPMAASKDVGVDWLDPTGFGTPSDFAAFKILEDTPTVHHVIVCALCSCYPRPILGNSPEWYRTPNYRRRIVRWPRPVLAEFGLELPDHVEVRVQDSNQKHRFMVMPMRPEGTEGWTEDQLAEIITRDSLIGVALPKPGVTANVTTKTIPAVRPIVG